MTIKLDTNLFTSDKMIPLGIIFISLTFFIFNLDYASNGDIVYYSNIIDTLRFDQLTLHQGYFVIGAICKYVFGWMFGMTTDQSLTLMSALFGSAALFVGYVLLKRTLRTEKEALLGTLILFMCHRFYINAITAEVYIVQAFLIWGSYLAFYSKQYIVSGLLFALALWTTPLAIAFVLFFPVVAYIYGLGVNSLIRFCVPVVLVYIPFLLTFYQELLWGVRGVINEDASRDIELIKGAKDVFKYQIKHYSFLNVLLIPALFAIRRESRLAWITLAVILPNVYVVTQLHGEENVFILPIDLFIACWCIIGWRVLIERSHEWIAVSAFIAHFALFIFVERPLLLPSNKNYGDEFREIWKVTSSIDNSILFADWSRRMALVYYNRDKASYPLEEGPMYEATFDIDHIDITRFNKVKAEPEMFDQYDAVLVLETYAPSMHSRLFIDDKELMKGYEQRSERLRIERFLDVACEPIRPGIISLYRCY